MARKGALSRDAATWGEGKEAEKVLGEGQDEELLWLRARPAV